MALLASGLAMPVVGSAAVPSPHWTVISTPAPTYFKPGDEGDFFEVIAVNDGGAPTDGSVIKVTDTLPGEVTATAIYGDMAVGLHDVFGHGMGCPTHESCESSGIVPPGELVRVKVLLSVSPEATGQMHGSVTIAGGGAAPATASQTATISTEPVPFGASLASAIAAESGFQSQAASHPVGFTTMLAFNVSAINTEECTLISISPPGCSLLNADVKDLEVALPPGLVGDPTAIPRCTQTVFQEYGDANCPPDTQVGVLHAGFYGGGTRIQYAPIYNVEPPPGQPAELGFTVGGLFHIPMFFHVRSDGDFALVAQLTNVSEGDPVQFGILTIWGVPASPIHDSEREGNGSSCTLEGCSIEVDEERPFLTLPGRCSEGELQMSATGDSWQKPLGNLPLLSVARLPALTGCEALSFTPSITVQPDSLQAGAPTSYNVGLKVPQNKEPYELGTPDVRDVQLMLPQGTMLSPAAAHGLAACTEQQFELHHSVPAHCPRQAKVGELSIVTPLLEAPLHGSVFLGAPECAPCTPADAQAGRMVPLLLEAEGSGVIIKLAGHTSVNQATGEITTTFTDNPQLPFSDLEISLKGGDNAPLVNPTACGNAIAVAKLTPWSAITATEATAPPIAISGCGTPSFSPSLRAGTTSAQAGAFSTFSVSLTRPDGQQDLRSVTVAAPQGLLGMLSKVELCGEAQAGAGTCPQASEIGIASTTVGRGISPLTVGGGKVYLTGPYEGRPFGLSIVIPAEAGPFQLAGDTGNGTEVVRASIAVDPYTGAVTVASRSLPTELNGIPLDIRSVDVDVNRVGFMFNPTNCSPLSVGAAFTSTDGTTTHASFPFQAVDCARLPFRPKFAVTTQAKSSKKGGASLRVKVTSGSGQANIGEVKVDLPRQLPSRLTTLQKACVAAVFDVNPANCPAASVVGTGRAVTPVLSRPLRGPAYLVSHGGAAFPDLEIVLQGEGITLILDGKTSIKKGITSSAFRSVPDAPISTFDLVLPEGPHSVLAANLPARTHGSMCGQKLTMPTVMTGQNGASVHKATVVSITGCRKPSRRR
jgi:hypothetical protein